MVAVTPSEDPVTVYPNPSNGTFHLSLKEKASVQVRIMNNLGQVVYNEQTTPNTTDQTVNLTNVPAGIYYVQVTGHTGTETTRIVIEK